jgi:3'-phosphoadenosine 5'-phosphosulfate sulfotransferase (PAPS reductase)/FAD synthetase
MDEDPFLITGPAVISFSGGRTSAFMLWRILQAHGGTLPDDVVVSFQNTGREMPATLDFVRDCGEFWGIEVVWLEYRRDAATGHVSTVRVTYDTASRAGEPFAQMIGGKMMLPNPVTRFCTIELKIRALKRWLMTELGWLHWRNVVGLRADEMGRVERALGPQRDRWTNLTPLADAGVTKMDVLRFWRGQNFDLALAGPWEGNCDGCFLKSRGAIARMMADHPERMEWWVASEHRIESTKRPGKGSVFRSDRDDYATMAHDVRDQGVLPMSWLEAAMPCTAGGCGV